MVDHKKALGFTLPKSEGFLYLIENLIPLSFV